MFKDYVDADESTIATMMYATKTLNAFLADPENQSSVDFNDLAHEVSIEAFGQPKEDDFRGISHMARYFASRRNVLRRILVAEGILPKRPKGQREPNNQTTFKEWARQHNY